MNFQICPCVKFLQEARCTALRVSLFSMLLIHSYAANAVWYEESEGIMGTEVAVKLWHDNEAQAKQCAARVFNDMRRIDALMSPYIETSEVALLNRQAAKAPVKVSAELFQLIATAQGISQLSGGAFDISFASVGKYYDYRNKQQPDAAKIQSLLAAIDYHQIQLDQATRSVRFLHPQLQIDLGGIAKGHAVDQAIRLLRECGVQHAIVSAGGDSYLLGDKRGYPWFVGIKDPRNTEQQAVNLPLQDIAISTSGDYERFFFDGTQRVHHIISPKTGHSAAELQSVSILASDSTTADALSTTVFVMGLEKGMALIDSLSGIDAIIIDNHHKLFYSADLMQAVKK